MNEVAELRRGAFMRRRGATWQVKLITADLIHLENPNTGEVDRMTLSAWQHGCYEGTIEMTSRPDGKLTDSVKELRSVALDDLKPKMKKGGERAADYVSAYLDPYTFFQRHYPERPVTEYNLPRSKSKRSLRPFLCDVARALQDPKPPGASTLCEWLETVAIVGTVDARALAPRHDKRGPRSRHMDVRIQNMLDDIIDTTYLATATVKKCDVFGDLRDKVRDYNKANPASPLEMISERHVSRYIAEEIDQYTEARRRYGKEYADQHFKEVGTGPEPEHILDVVEVDHSRGNVELVDDETGQVLGRPWVTCALDRRSRMPVGVHVHFDGQSLGAVMACLKSVMSPKDFVEKWGFGKYDVWGVPVAYYFDRGPDYDTDHIREVARTLDIRTDYEPVKCPQYKGKIERFHRTMQEQVCHPLPGATPPAGKNGIVRDKDDNAYVTFSEFVERLWRWIVTVYVKQQHRTLKDTPMNVWRAGYLRRPVRPLRKKDDLRILMTRVEIMTPSRTGVRWNNLNWNGSVIREIRSNPNWTRVDKSSKAKIGDDLAKTGKLKVRINEENLAEAWVTHPLSRQMVLLEPSMPKYMKGLTLHQHVLAQRIVNEHMDGLATEENLLEARRFLREQAKELMGRKTTRKSDRVRAARVLGTAPDDDVPPPAAPEPPVTIEPTQPEPAAPRAPRKASKVVRRGDLT